MSRGRRQSPQHRARAHAIDVHVGGRIKQRRIMLGMSLEKLGAELGLTFQQIQKYERGANRISAGALALAARTLDVPVSFFFDDLPPDLRMRPAAPDPLVRRQTLELARNFHAIRNTETQHGVAQLVKSIARADEEDGAP